MFCHLIFRTSVRHLQYPYLVRRLLRKSTGWLLKLPVCSEWVHLPLLCQGICEPCQVFLPGGTSQAPLPGVSTKTIQVCCPPSFLALEKKQDYKNAEYESDPESWCWSLGPMNSLSKAAVRPFSHGLAYLASSPIPRFSVVETVARPGVGPAFPPIVIQGRRQGPSSGEPAPLPELLQLRPPSCSLLCQVTHQSLPAFAVPVPGSYRG